MTSAMCGGHMTVAECHVVKKMLKFANCQTQNTKLLRHSWTFLNNWKPRQQEERVELWQTVLSWQRGVFRFTPPQLLAAPPPPSFGVFSVECRDSLRSSLGASLFLVTGSHLHCNSLLLPPSLGAATPLPFWSILPPFLKKGLHGTHTCVRWLKSSSPARFSLGWFKTSWPCTEN